MLQKNYVLLCCLVLITSFVVYFQTKHHQAQSPLSLSTNNESFHPFDEVSSVESRKNRQHQAENDLKLSEGKLVQPETAELKVIENSVRSDPLQKPQKLWSSASPEMVEVESGLMAQKVRLKPDFYQSLKPGSVLEMAIAELKEPVHITLTETRNAYGGRHVWRGAIENGRPFDRFSMTRGEKLTILSVGTRAGVFTLTVDNETGEGILVNESEAVMLAPLS